MALSVGEVAGIINVAVVILQFTFPLLVTFILAGLVPKSVNAATWSVTGRLLNGSWWPSILRTDSAATHKVDRNVILLSKLMTLGLLILAFAAVVTPLGLYTTTINTSSKPKTFVHAEDDSPLGQSVMSRRDYNTSRLCGHTSCPGQYHGFSDFQNSSGAYVNQDSDDSYVSSVMPQNLTEIFSSGRDNVFATVATPFDLQYRAYYLAQDSRPSDGDLNRTDRVTTQIDHYAKYTVGEMQYAYLLIPLEDIMIVDGLVVDMVKGGIGFRNHTVPENVHDGAEWTEALLWVEPETGCIPVNVSVEYHQTEFGTSGTGTAYIIDEGGLVSLPKNFSEIDFTDTQRNPQLFDRAKLAAVLVNFSLRQRLQINASSESWLGRKFQVENESLLQPGTMSAGPYSLLAPGVVFPLDTIPNDSLSDRIDIMTKGYGSGDVADFTRIGSNGGIVLGALTNVDMTESSNRFDSDTYWSAPLYSCSTALRAYIMDVTFFINGTSVLENLRVKSMSPRRYAGNDTVPLWAVENATDFYNGDLQPIWGLVNDSCEFNPRLWTLRRDFMYLPAGQASLFDEFYLTDTQGCAGPLLSLGLLYSDLRYQYQIPNYFRPLDLTLKRKWRALSSTAEGIAKIMAIIWTDITANILTSSRSQLNAKYITPLDEAARAAQNVPTTIQVNIQTLERVVRYHVLYAVIGIVFLVLYFVAACAALIICCRGTSTTISLSSMLNQTSVGRASTIGRLDDSRESDKVALMTTKEWIRSYGSENIRLTVRKRQDSDSSEHCLDNLAEA